MALFKRLSRNTGCLQPLSQLNSSQQRYATGGFTPADMPMVKNKWVAAQKVGTICVSMKNIAAGALPGAERHLSQARPFGQATLSIFELNKDPDDVQNILHIPIGTERGMCGVLSGNTVKHAYKMARKERKKKHKVIVYGKRSAAIARTLFGNDLVVCFGEVKTKVTTFEFVSQLTEFILNKVDFDWDKTVIYYNEYQNAVRFHLKSLTVYKTDIAKIIADIQLNGYEIEGNNPQIISNLVEFKLAAQIYSSLAENFASEQGSRLKSMDTASKNCKEMEDEYDKVYQGLRKTKITNALIISAVASKLVSMNKK